MTHTGSPKKVIFSLNEVEITKISNGKVIEKVLLITLQRYTSFPLLYPTQTPMLFLLMLMKHAIFGMKYLAILTTNIFLI